MGFGTDHLRNLTKELESVRFAERDDSVSIRASKARFNCRFRQIFLLGVFSGMVGYWGYLYSLQKNGAFLDGSLQVQFGDETFGALQYAFFSGTYEQSSDDIIAQRPVYYERGVLSNRSSGRFFYCEEEQAWVFAIGNVTKSKERDDGCNWLLRSLKTKKYDLAEVPSFGWKIWTGRVQDVQFLQMQPGDCSTVSDCNYHGTCLSDGSCECDPGWLGKSCRFEEALCEEITFYIEDSPIQNFTVLRDENGQVMTAYERPMYYGRSTNDERLIVIIFTGRRWFVTVWDESELATVKDLRSTLSVPFFHAFWSQIYERNTVVFSQPTYAIMPVSADVRWDILGATRSRGDFGVFGFWKSVAFASMHCAKVDCSIPLACGVNGVCQNSTCVCQNNTTGHFCQYPFSPQISAARQTHDEL